MAGAISFIALVVMTSAPADPSGDPCQAGLPNTTAKLWSEIDKVVGAIHLLVAKRHQGRGERKKRRGRARAPNKAFASAAQISGGIFLYPRQASLLTEMVRQQAESAAARRQQRRQQRAGPDGNSSDTDTDTAGQRFVVCETG